MKPKPSIVEKLIPHCVALVKARNSVKGAGEVRLREAVAILLILENNGLLEEKVEIPGFEVSRAFGALTFSWRRYRDFLSGAGVRRESLDEAEEYAKVKGAPSLRVVERSKKEKKPKAPMESEVKEKVA